MPNDSPFEDKGASQPPVATVKTRGPVKVQAKKPAAKPTAKPKTALGQAASNLPAVATRAPFSGVELPQAEPEETNLPAPASTLPDGRTRVPFGQQVRKLDYPPREGYQRRWINDYPGRVGRAQMGGWVHVEENGRPIETNVGSQGLKAFLMEIPDQFYDEDFEAKQEKLNDIDKQIYHGTHKQEAGDKRYVPPGAIKVGVQRGR